MLRRSLSGFLHLSISHWKHRHGRPVLRLAVDGDHPGVYPVARWKRLAAYNTLEESSIKGSQEEEEFRRSLLFGFVGKPSIAVISGGNRRRRPHQQVHGELAHLWTPILFPGTIYSSV
jgi:hypothetical protein